MKRTMTATLMLAFGLTVLASPSAFAEQKKVNAKYNEDFTLEPGQYAALKKLHLSLEFVEFTESPAGVKLIFGGEGKSGDPVMCRIQLSHRQRHRRCYMNPWLVILIDSTEPDGDDAGSATFRIEEHQGFESGPLGPGDPPKRGNSPN